MTALPPQLIELEELAKQAEELHKQLTTPTPRMCPKCGIFKELHKKPCK